MNTSPDNGLPTATSPFSSAQGAIDAASTPQEGANFLAEFWIEQGVPFTSGHVVDALRKGRNGDPNFQVFQSAIGSHLRGEFDAGNMPSYDDGCGDPIRPERKLRQTTRTDTRTPVGTEVFVVGPSDTEIDLFEFELDIATATPTQDAQGNTVSPAAALLNATPNTAPSAPNASPLPPVQPSGAVAVAYGKMVPGDPTAVVHSDGRLCIPRIALEALAFETGEAITGGDALHVTLDGNDLSVSQTAGANSFPAIPTTDRLRLHLTIPGGPKTGTEYTVKVASDRLTVDLDSPE